MSPEENNGQFEILQVMRGINDVQSRDQTTLQVIRSFLTKTKLFKGIVDVSDYSYIVSQTALLLRYQKYKYGEFLFHQGERGDNLYFVLSGRGSVYIPKEEYELKSEIVYYSEFQGEQQIDDGKQDSQEQKNTFKKQIEPAQKNTASAKNDGENGSFQQLIEQNQDERKDPKVSQISKFSGINNADEDDETSILALNEKHHPRYFRISREFSMYKRVRFEQYLDYFGELAAEEQFNRRMASVVASSKEQDFEVAYISLMEFKSIFSNVLENLYLIQHTLCDQLINSSKKQTINFSYLFSETIKLERGQVLFSEGTPVNGIFIVRKGTISIKKLNSESKQLLQLAILSAKDIFGHEDAFSTSLARTISAVSEGYGTVVQFAKIEDIFAFLKYHKDLEKELKRKSELKMNFYKKRITNLEHVILNNSQIYMNQKDKRVNKVKMEDDQTTIFNKFLLNSREKLITSDDKSAIRSINTNGIPMSKILGQKGSQILDAGNFLKQKSILQQDQVLNSNAPTSQKEISLVTKRTQNGNEVGNNFNPSLQDQQQQPKLGSFKGRTNLRTRSLINIKSEFTPEQYNNLISQSKFQQESNSSIGQMKKNNHASQHQDGLYQSIYTTEQQQSLQQSGIPQSVSNQGGRHLMRQSTFSQHSLHKYGQQSSLNHIDEISPFQSVVLNQDQSQKSLINSQLEQIIGGKNAQTQKQMSKKLKDAIAGQWNAKPENWTVDQIEQQVKMNQEKLQINQSQNIRTNIHKIENNNQQLRLTYLHNDMDSFEHAKKFVILKRERKKNQYLHSSQNNLSGGQNTVQGYKKQQLAKQQKARSPTSGSPLQRQQQTFYDKFERFEDEDPFFNPHTSIQKFSRFLYSTQQSLKSIDHLPNDISRTRPSSSVQKGNFGRLSLQEINSPNGLASTLNSFQLQSPQVVIKNRLKTTSNNKQRESTNQEQQNEEEKQTKSPVVQLKQCQSTFVEPENDNNDNKNDENNLSTSIIEQGNFQEPKQIPPKLQLNLSAGANKIFSRQFPEKPKVPMIAFETLQNFEGNNDSNNSKSFSKDQIEAEKPLKENSENPQKVFLLNITSSPIPRIFEMNSPLHKSIAENSQTPQRKLELFQMTNEHRSPLSAQIKQQNKSSHHHVAFSGIELDDNSNQNDVEAKYFLNPNYSQSNNLYSPIVIQKLESQKHSSTNGSSLFQSSKQQISFVQPSLSQHDRNLSIENSTQHLPHYQNGRCIQFTNTKNQNNQQQQVPQPSKNTSSLYSRNIKSQVNMSRQSNKFNILHSQKLTSTKLNQFNSQIPISSIKKQINNSNNSLLKNQLQSQVPKPGTAADKSRNSMEFKTNQSECQELLSSPIHHSSLSPNLRKSKMDRIQSSNKISKNNFTCSVNSLTLYSDKEQQQYGSSSSPTQNQQRNQTRGSDIINRFSIDTITSVKEDNPGSHQKNNSNYYNAQDSSPQYIVSAHKDSRINISTGKNSNCSSPQNNSIQSKNTQMNLLKKSLFNQQDSTRNNFLSNAFPSKPRAEKQQSSQNTLKEQNGNREGSQKRQNTMALSNKFNFNQFQQINSESPQSMVINQQQLMTITPYQSSSNLSSPTLISKYPLLHLSCSLQHHQKI